MESIQRARISLDGLSVGDAFGERFFQHPAVVESLIANRAVPDGTWSWTDDTAMAISVVEILGNHQAIVPTELARAFADRYAKEPRRGYGGGAHRILTAIGNGVPHQHAAGSVFDGSGSFGNGGAMRAAPIGAYFYDDVAATVENARASAEPTHAHPEGIAGAIAIAVAAGEAWRQSVAGICDGQLLLDTVIEHTPVGESRENLRKARELGLDVDVATAKATLGTGANVSAQDTVGFSVLMAAQYLNNFEEAMWATVSGLGDRDTTCAIVGGIVACFVKEDGIPLLWMHKREVLGA